MTLKWFYLHSHRRLGWAHNKLTSFLTVHYLVFSISGRIDLQSSEKYTRLLFLRVLFFQPCSNQKHFDKKCNRLHLSKHSHPVGFTTVFSPNKTGFDLFFRSRSNSCLAQTGAQLKHRACSACLQYVQKQPSPLIHTDRLHLLSFRAKSYQVPWSKTSSTGVLQIRSVHFLNALQWNTPSTSHLSSSHHTTISSIHKLWPALPLSMCYLYDLYAQTPFHRPIAGILERSWDTVLQCNCALMYGVWSLGIGRKRWINTMTS